VLHTARYALSLAVELNLPEVQAWANYFMGAVYYQWNELDRSVARLAPIVQQPLSSNGIAFANAACALALTYQAQGRSTEARTITAAAVEHLRAASSLCMNTLEIFQVELALRQGKLGAATQWAAQHSAPMPLAPALGFVATQLIRPKILLAQGSAAARREAVDLLLAAQAFYAAIHNTRFLVETQALLALAWWVEGDTKALEVLAAALRLAAPGGLLRVFVDIGPALLPPLELLEASAAPAFMAQLKNAMLRAFPTTPADSRAELMKHAAAGPHSLVEALTPREHEILALLAQRLTNKEIAHTLGISADTVKEHISNVLGKLGVADRRTAVAKALSAGLLPPE
jgi:LuxR family maltose regulon positive regulatory protein